VSQSPASPDESDVGARIARVHDGLSRVRDEIARVVVGMEDVVDELFAALLAGGHVLLEGPPGLGKTLLVKSLASALDLEFARVQCTPDLLPADVTGAEVLSDSDSRLHGGGTAQLAFREGPVFTNVLLVDEINRATPRTQSALLEAMEESRVTSGRTSRDLPDPFAVFATQNPIEMEGTYPLPEAQLDRFLAKVLLVSPSVEDLVEIVRRTTGPEQMPPAAVLGADAVRAARALTREIALAPALAESAARLVAATHPDSPHATDAVRRAVRLGASPRGARALVLGAKARALLAGRPHVGSDDLQRAMLPALRHRLVLSFEAEASGTTPDAVLADLAAGLRN